jgi:hypothetical protein
MRMKLLLFLTLGGINWAVGADCVSISRTHYVSGWEEVDARQLIQDPITPDGAVVCSFFPDATEKLNVLVREEIGTYSGIGYRIFHADGSGMIQGHADAPFNEKDHENNWALRCRLDEKQTLESCLLQKKDVTIRRDAKEVVSLGVGNNHQPGSEMLIRIDRNWAITASAQEGFSEEQTTQILTQMKAGRQLDTRYQESSRQWKTDKTMTLFGFKQALEIMEIVMDRIAER